MWTDAEAILSVWRLIKDGGTWGAPGPPSWVITKQSSTQGTLVFGALDARTVVAFREAGVTLKGLPDEPSC